MKIRPVGAELFHADGQTDTTQLIVAFRNFANSPKSSAFCPHSVYAFSMILTADSLLLLTTALTDCYLYWIHSVFPVS
jgi:hypothetical protein